GIQKMRRNTLIFLLLFLAVGIPVIIFLSRKLSAPVSKLEMEKKKNQRYQKNNFLRRLLHGEEQHSEEELSARFQKHSLNITLYDHFRLFLFRIDDYTSFRDQFSPEDREEKKNSIISIIGKFIPGHAWEAVDSEDDTIAVINAVGDNQNPDMPFFRGIQREIKNSLSISVSITRADGGEGIIRDIYTVYSEAMDVSWNRYFEGTGCILDCSIHGSKPSSRYDYPYQKEKLFTEMLLMNRLRESRTVFREILGTSRGFSQTAFQTALQRLVLSVYSALDRYRKNSATGIAENIKSPLSSLFSCDTAAEIEEQLFSYLAETIPLFQVKKENNHNQLVGDIIEDIKRNYPDHQLCAEHYAEKYSLSTVYLGRLFKQHTTKSIAEFINNVRIETAKKLLTTTADPVNDIVKTVGFTYPNYFFSIFKKYNGVTPLEFRQKHYDVNDSVQTLKMIK
ncbi:MAG: helix-turn-helix domain-containing protein, partial [Spirochaetia bacterium]